MNQNQFFRLLFDYGQSTCLTSDKYGIDVYKLPLKFYSTEFFSINAMHTFRKDENVTCFRNFLLEFDSGSVDEHMKAMENVPYSTAVYSGGKSTHFIISLEDPLYDITEYKQLARRLHALVPTADPSTKNPSRLSRTPDVTRKDSGLKQDLLFVGDRIPNKILLDELPDLQTTSMISGKKRPVSVIASITHVMLNPNEAMIRLNLAGRNALFFWLGQRLLEIDYDFDEKCRIVRQTYDNLSNKDGFPLTEAMQAARLDE